MTVTGFYPILDMRFPLVDAAEAVLEAGARILQIRHKGSFLRDDFEAAQRVAVLCRAANALLIVNDRADIAAMLGAGVHLGQEDLAPADARRIMPAGAVIGFSTHNVEQLHAGEQEPVDYLAIGPIFQTRSKQNPDPVVGIQRLRSSKPLVAIGGITRENALSVLDAGADAVAVIADLYPSPLTKASLRARAEEWIAICSSRTSRPL